MTFGFNIYATPLLAILVIYFGTRLGNLVSRKLLEGSEVYYH